MVGLDNRATTKFDFSHSHTFTFKLKVLHRINLSFIALL